MKKKNLKYYYCKNKGYFKLECRKFKADFLSGNAPDNKKGQFSKSKTTKVIVALYKILVNLFMA